MEMGQTISMRQRISEQERLGSLLPDLQGLDGQNEGLVRRMSIEGQSGTRRWNAQVSHRERRNEHKQEDVLKRKRKDKKDKTKQKRKKKERKRNRRVIQNQYEHRSQRVNSERIEKAKKGVIATLRHQNVNPIEWVGE